MAEERRHSERKRLLCSPLFFWKGRSEAYEGCFYDIAPGGCFVNTLGPAETGETVSFELFCPPDEVVGLSGSVIHTRSTGIVGFGMRFAVCSANADRFIRFLMARSEDSGRQ